MRVLKDVYMIGLINMVFVFRDDFSRILIYFAPKLMKYVLTVLSLLVSFQLAIKKS
jgi:hypothetical protein